MGQSQLLPVKRLLKQHEIRPRKSLGQNFIISQVLLRAIIAAAEMGEGDTILEIGAGLGSLTRALAERAQRVIALEIDERLIPLLRGSLADHPNVQIVLGDILKIDLEALLPAGYKAVGNLPYYATSAILRRLLEGKPQPQLLIVTVQREVAERLVAGPGAMSLLAVSVQFYGRPQMVTRAPPGAFYPSPKVSSALVRIEPHPRPPLPEEDIAPFFSLVRAGFSQRRKYLKNSLPQGLRLPTDEVVAALNRSGIDEKGRPQDLSVEEWLHLYGEMAQVLKEKGEQRI